MKNITERRIKVPPIYKTFSKKELFPEKRNKFFDFLDKLCCRYSNIDDEDIEFIIE